MIYPDNKVIQGMADLAAMAFIHDWTQFQNDGIQHRTLVKLFEQFALDILETIKNKK